MQAVRTTRTQRSSKWSARIIAPLAVMLIASCATSPTDSATAATTDNGLRVLNPPGALIVDGANTKRVTVQVPKASATSGAKVVATLYRYDDNADMANTPVSNYSGAATGDKGDGQVSFNVQLPTPGLYALDMKIVSASGASSGTSRVSLASLMSGNGTFTDAGVVTHFGQRKGNAANVLPLIKRAGFTWIRDELYWQELEKSPGKFTFPPDNNNYGAYVSQAASMGLKPLIILDYGNASTYPGMFKAKRGFPKTPAERDLFVRYVQQVVGHYGNQVKAWELWNEPKFGVDLTYDDYIALLKPVYAAVKKASPDSSLISCGGGGAGGGPGGDCIANLIKGGAVQYQDGFSIHPYMSPYNPDDGYLAKGSPLPKSKVSVSTVWPHLEGMVQKNPRPGVGPLKLWITEIGWPSSPASGNLSEQKQAAYLARTLLLSRRFNAVQTVIWYDFVNDGTNPADKENNFGLVNLDLTPKPAYVAAATLTRTVGSRDWSRSLVDNGQVKVFQYGSSGDPVYVGWTADADADSSPMQVPIPPGQYTQRDWQGSTTTVTVGPNFQWKLGALPKYLIPVR
jgi:polysaccharide biosynthesis protein PslG